MKFKIKAIPSLLKESFKEWSDDNAMRLAAALAYYTVFSLAPLLLAAISIGGLVFGPEAAAGRIYQDLKGGLGPSVATSVQDLVMAASKPAAGITGAIIAFVFVVFGASGVFGELKDSLNIIWNVKPQEGGGIWTWIRGRFLSITMVMGVCFLMLVSLVINSGMGAVGELSTKFLPAIPYLLQAMGMLVSFAFVTVLFAMMFKYLPDTKIAWRDVWVGAIATAALFSLGKSALEIYISKAGVASSYGAAGAMALILVWVYYSAQIFFFGAEFAEVYSRRFGTRQGAATEPPAQENTQAEVGLAPKSQATISPAPVALSPVRPEIEHISRPHTLAGTLGSVAALGAVLTIAWIADKKRPNL